MPGVAGKSQAQARLLIWMWCLVGRLSRDPVKRPSLSDKKDKKKKKKRSASPPARRPVIMPACMHWYPDRTPHAARRTPHAACIWPL